MTRDFMPWRERQREAERPTMPPPMIRTGIWVSEDMVCGGFLTGKKATSFVAGEEEDEEEEEDYISFLY